MVLMKYGPMQWLLVSAALEILASCLLGYVMLVPMQPWAGRLREKWPKPHALMSVHLDLVMLALMQIAAGLGMKAIPTAHDPLVSGLLISSGWLNVTPYAWRLARVNAFVLGGGPLQLFASLTSLLGTVLLAGGWLLLLGGWL